MALHLARSADLEAVELEPSGDVDDAGLVFAGGEVAGLLRGPGAGSVGAVADEEPWVEDLEEEGGDGQVKLVRGGEAAVTESVAAASALGKLILWGGMAVASTAAPVRTWMAW